MSDKRDLDLNDKIGLGKGVSLFPKPAIRRMQIVSLLLLAALIIGGSWFYNEQKQNIRTNIQNELTSIGILKEKQITAWRQTRLKDVTQLSKNRVFIRYASALLSVQKPESSDDIRDFLRLYLAEHEYYSNIILTDSRGQIRLNLTAGTAGKLHPADITALARSWRDHKSEYIDLHACENDLKICLGVTAPLFTGSGSAGTPIGAIVLVTDANKFLFPLVQSWPVPSATAETLLVRRDGNSVLYLNNLRNQSNTALKLRLPLTRTDLPAVKAVLGHEGIIEGRNYRGIPVISAIRAIPDSHWFMIAQIDTDEALANWKIRAASILILLLSITIMAGALMLVLWQRTTKAYYLALHESDEAKQRSEKLLSATLRSIGDGVITCDVAGNVISVNAVGEKLTGWNTDSAMGRPVSDIFRIVHSVTRQQAEIPVARALLENRIIGLASHTSLIALDGTERQIADSCAPIHDAAGVPVGAVLVFRDVTEEYLRRTQIQDSESRLDQLTKQSGIIVWETDAQGLYTFISHVSDTVFGYHPEELVGRMHFYDLCPEPERETLKKAAFAVFERKESFKDLVNIILTKNGRRTYVSTNGLPLLNADGTLRGYRGSDTDITWRKQAEEYKEMSRELLQILNKPVALRNSIHRVLATLKKGTGCDAVGIRLQDGNDFPYLSQLGFPKDFLSIDNTLLERGADGGVCRDKDGEVRLKCICGMVLSGKTDQANPIFTSAGSAWTNNSFKPPDTPPGEETRLHPRYQCIDQGYASVALIPIRDVDGIAGLIHLTYRDKQRLTLAAVEHLEEIATHIGEALMRKQADEKFIDSKILVDTVVENIPLMLFLKKAGDLSFVMLNRAGEQLLGRDRSDFIGKNDLDFFPPDQATRFMAKDRAVLEENGHLTDIPEEPILTAKKGVRLLHTQKVAIKGADGTPQYLLGISEDITERKQAETYREMGREVLQLLTGPGDLKDLIKRVVAVLKKGTGIDAVGVRLQNGEDFPYLDQEGFPKTFLSTENSLLERAADGSICRDKDGHVKLECTCGLVISGNTDPSNPLFTTAGSFWTNDSLPMLDLTADKDPRYHPRNQCMHLGYSSMALVPIRDEKKIIGLLHLDDRRKGFFSLANVELLEGIASNIGAALMRRRSEEALKETAEAKSKFASMVSHELRSPLTAITLGISLILEQAEGLSPEHKNLLELVHDNTDRLGRLINNVLDFQKMAAGKMTFHMLENDINDLIHTTSRSMGLLAKDKGLELTVDINNDIPPAIFDKDKITQVLTNLLANAIAHTEKGIITVSADCAAGTLHVAVRDTGLGIKPENLSRLFQPFEQLDSGGARKTSGTGLGLAISKDIILAHNGKIWAESVPGKGSVFHFSLPVKQS